MGISDENKTFIITKRIAKHGKQAIIIIPSIIQGKLKPGTLAEVEIRVIDNKD